MVVGLKQIRLRAETKLETLETLIDKLQKFQFLMFSDPYQSFLSTNNQDDDISFVLTLAKSNYLNGENPLSSIQTLAKNLLNAQVWLRKRTQIEYLIGGRFLFVVCVVCVVRSFIVFSYLPSFVEMQEFFFEKDSVLGGFFVCIIVQSYFSYCYPTHWFWDLEFTETAKNWLALKFNEGVLGSNKILKKLHILEKKEQLVGLDLREEKEQLIDFWSIQLDLENQFKKDKFDDGLPLFEFISYSVYAILLLHKPLKQCFKFSLDMSF